MYRISVGSICVSVCGSGGGFVCLPATWIPIALGILALGQGYCQIRSAGELFVLGYAVTAGVSVVMRSASWTEICCIIICASVSAQLGVDNW